MRDELGDLLLQVVLAELAADRSAFCITDVVRGITEKMIRRHPHVFGGVQVSSSAEVSHNWEQIKAAEKQANPGARLRLRWSVCPRACRRCCVPSGSAKGGPGPTRRKLARSSAGAGPRSLPRWKRVQAASPVSGEERTRLEQGLGKLLFSLCQLARQLGVNAEDSLHSTTLRFTERFREREEKPSSG